MTKITVKSPTTGKTRQVEQTITRQGKTFQYVWTKPQKNYSQETDLYEWKAGNRSEWVGKIQPFVLKQDSTGT